MIILPIQIKWTVIPVLFVILFCSSCAYNSTVFCRGVAVDKRNNIIITGEFRNTADFGGIKLTSKGEGDIFVAKLDNDGNWLWAKHIGTTKNDVGQAVAVDKQGNIVVVGSFGSSMAPRTTIDFGSIKLTSKGEGDIFVAKLDNDGNWLWAKQAHGDGINDVTVDKQGNIVVVGSFGSSMAPGTTADFGSIKLTSKGEGDIFVAKLDNDGNWLWAKQAGSVLSDLGHGLALDRQDNILITGEFRNTADFGGIKLTSKGEGDIFVAKLDNDGNWLWAQRAGSTTYYDMGIRLAIDKQDSAFIVGKFRDTADFGKTVLHAKGPDDTFVAKLDSKGHWLWARRAGGPSFDRGLGILIDNQDRIFVSGTFNDTADFGTTKLTSKGKSDIFVAKLDNDGNWLWARRAGGSSHDEICNVRMDNKGYIISGIFRGSLSLDKANQNSGEFSNRFVWKMKPSL